MSAAKCFTDIQVQSAFGSIREAFRKNGYVEIKWKDGSLRSLNQNALSHSWYQQMAREDRSEDELGHKAYCKLHHGIPMLRAEDAEFKTFYDAALLGLTYEQKLAAMQFVPVTSRMTTDQLSRYLKAVKDDYADNRGIILEFPDEHRWGP